RKLRACSPEMHSACLEGLQRTIGESDVYIVGKNPQAALALGDRVSDDPAVCRTILVIGDGMTTDDGSALIAEELDRKRILFVGPSTAGPCSLTGWEHWCPYGRR
ncbi:MAG: hypothetical protein LUQ25_04645, partial [Methanoregulaceae archaeon]|nr:hypothetical protein [Methanoregulaceae archaeon]